MDMQHLDRTSTHRPGRRLAATTAALLTFGFLLVAAAMSVAPSARAAAGAPTATAAASTCVAKMPKGSKLVDVTTKSYKYAYKKIKGSRKYRRYVKTIKVKLRVSCTRQCVRTKVVRGKRVPVYKTVRKKVRLKRGNRIVTARKKVKAYVFEKCKASSASSAGQPVTITLLDGSEAHLDFGSFQRVAPLTGQFNGFVAGGFKTSADNQISLTRGTIALGATDVFIDDNCNGMPSASIRTGSPATVGLDPTKKSTSTVAANAAVTATAYTIIKLPLELRNDDDGCNKPYISTGYTDFAKTFFLSGKIQSGTGLQKITLTSAPDPLDVQACLVAGIPTQPCTGWVIPLPIIVSTKLIVKISFQ